MQVFHTAGVPPKSGVIILPAIGWTKNSKSALTKSVSANAGSVKRESADTRRVSGRVFHDGHGWPIVMVRPFNAYGPRQTVDRIIPEVIIRALRGQSLKMTQGRQTREFNYVEDIADGMVRAMLVPGIEGELFNICCGEDVSIRTVTETILNLLGNPVEAEFGALPDRPTEIWVMRGDNTRARERLGRVEGVHAPADLHDQLRRRAAARPGRAVRRGRRLSGPRVTVVLGPRPTTWPGFGAG